MAANKRSLQRKRRSPIAFSSFRQTNRSVHSTRRTLARNLIPKGGDLLEDGQPAAESAVRRGDLSRQKLQLGDEIFLVGEEIEGRTERVDLGEEILGALLDPRVVVAG